RGERTRLPLPGRTRQSVQQAGVAGGVGHGDGGEVRIPRRQGPLTAVGGHRQRAGGASRAARTAAVMRPVTRRSARTIVSAAWAITSGRSQGTKQATAASTNRIKRSTF